MRSFWRARRKRRYYGQTPIAQPPALTRITATASDADLAWAETASTITITCYDQYGQLFGGWAVIGASIISGNGTIAPASKSISSSGSGTWTYTRGGNDPGDLSPLIQFTASNGATGIVSIALRDASGEIMV